LTFKNRMGASALLSAVLKPGVQLLALSDRMFIACASAGASLVRKA
jgi:hypothetical protein